MDSKERSLPSTLLTIVLLAATGWIFVWYVNVAFTRYPDFDGALNLNVAKSLLDGYGYRNFYDEWVAFFPETNAPYVFPAALSLAIFGPTPIGAQFVNLIYLAALLVLVYALVSRMSSALIGAVAVFVVAQTPGLTANGMNGYGEVPALVFLFAACLVLRHAIESDDRRFVALGGVLLALSYLTKTVSLIWIPGTALLFVVARPRSRRYFDSLILVASIALPVLAWELYRLATLHGIGGFVDWWTGKLVDILDRAGPGTRLRDTAGWAAKSRAHLALLEGWLGFPGRWFMLAYLAALAIGAVAAIRRWNDDAGGRFVFGALFIAAAIYLAWWVLLTPTQEAWLRRIMNGLIVGEVLAIVIVYKLARFRSPVTAAALVALALGLVQSVSHNQLLQNRPDDKVESAANRIFYERVAALPKDAELYAAAWYQSPVTALITGRRFYDLTRHAAAEMVDNSRKRFLVIEQVALYQPGWLAEVLGRCECEPVFANAGGRIYRIAAIDENASRAGERSSFVTAKSDGFGSGFSEAEADVRWASGRAEFRLPMTDFDFLVLWLHAPPSIMNYDMPRAPLLEIRRGKCLLARTTLSPGENQLVARNGCGVGAGSTLEFRTIENPNPSANDADATGRLWLFRTMELMSPTLAFDSREGASQDAERKS